MVAQFLRLKLRLLANTFRRSAWQLIGLVLGLIYGLGIAIIAFSALAALRLVDEVDIIRDGLVVAGSATVLGFILLPLVFGSNDTMDPRKFGFFGLDNRRLSFSLALAGLIGIPGLVLAIVLAGTVVTWTRDFGVTVFAVLAAALAYATCMLIARVSTATAAFVLATRRARELTGVVALLAAVAIAPVLVGLTTIDWSRSGLRVLETAAGWLEWSPLGAAFAAPGDAAAGAWGGAIIKLLIAAVFLWLVWLAWQALVAKMLVTPERESSKKTYRGLGWFDLVLPGAAGAIAARSLTYWFRDPRYWVSFIIVPIVPLLLMVPLSIAGLPMLPIALMPVPLMCLLLGWSLHNDTAYDSTAVWVHVASGTRGAADRAGRLVPVVLLGLFIIGIGGATTVFIVDDWRLLPSLLGVSTALLLGGLGVGSIMSAAFPYPAVRPGDSPFQAPQSIGSIGAFVQSLTMLGSIIVAAPAAWFAYRGFVDDPVWHESAFLYGVGAGLFVLVAGIIVGGIVFVKRGPEILAAAQRA